jgi:hypothetical protein
MKCLFSRIFVLLVLVAVSTAEDTAPSCKETTFPVVGKCFRFRGRLGLYNGGHTYWIWRVGTSHRYWVEGDLPAAIRKGSLDWDHSYWGNFDACPTTVFQNGYAQGICLRSSGKLATTGRTN